MQGLRKSWTLNSGWQFQSGRASRRWLRSGAVIPNVSLPHCWNEHDAFQEGVDYYRGPGAYRLDFDSPESAGAADGDGQWFLESDGFYGTGDVWLNGRRLGRVDGAYLGFRFDVTGRLNPDAPNRIAVRLTNRCARNVLPGISMPDFLLYGGLSGAVRLVRLPVLRVNARDLAVRCANVTGSHADVYVCWSLAGISAGGEADSIEWSMVPPGGGDPVSLEIYALRRGQTRGVTRIHVPSPRCWSPQDPCRYRLEGRLRRGPLLLDACSVMMGIRTVDFRSEEGLFLNGRRLTLRGCNRHESMPGFGRALPAWQHRQDAELIKKMGMNFVRLSHYPQHPDFLEACDDLGILVYAELASWKRVGMGGWLRRARRQWVGMIRRDRNHPSVILWGMGNEARHAGAFRSLYQWAKALDPQRAVTYAENHLYRARRQGTIGLPDVWGVNYELDALEEAVSASRQRVAVVSECANAPHSRRGDSGAEHAQREAVRSDLERIGHLLAVAGFALWCFNDYATLRKRRYRRFSGVVDAWRLPKATARWMSAAYGDGGLMTVDVPDPDAGPAARIALEMEPSTGWGETGEGTSAIRVRIHDRQGRLCDWTGELTARMASGGQARVRSFDGRGTVWVANGSGRTFAGSPPCGFRGSEKIRLEVSGGGLPAATLEMPPVSRDVQGGS